MFQGRKNKWKTENERNKLNRNWILYLLCKIKAHHATQALWLIIQAPPETKIITGRGSLEQTKKKKHYIFIFLSFIFSSLFLSFFLSFSFSCTPKFRFVSKIDIKEISTVWSILNISNESWGRKIFVENSNDVRCHASSVNYEPYKHDRPNYSSRNESLQ